MSATETLLLSVDDYAKLPEEEWRKYELSDGELVPRYGDEMSARPNHKRVRDRVIARLVNYLDENPIGVEISEQDYRLSPAVVRRPDVSVISNERKHILEGDPPIVPEAPDLAIEIVSPSNFSLDMERKVRQLFQAGCQIVWLIYPEIESAIVCEGEDRKQLEVDDALEAPALLPGFKLELRDILPKD